MVCIDVNVLCDATSHFLNIIYIFVALTHGEQGNQVHWDLITE